MDADCGLRQVDCTNQRADIFLCGGKEVALARCRGQWARVTIHRLWHLSYTLDRLDRDPCLSERRRVAFGDDSSCDALAGVAYDNPATTLAEVKAAKVRGDHKTILHCHCVFLS